MTERQARPAADAVLPQVAGWRIMKHVAARTAHRSSPSAIPMIYWLTFSPERIASPMLPTSSMLSAPLSSASKDVKAPSSNSS